MNNLKNISDEELRAELERRKKEKKESEKPKQLEIINVDLLREICQDYIDEIYKEGMADEDFDHWIFETAMETIFGKNIWEWINKQLKSFL